MTTRCTLVALALLQAAACAPEFSRPQIAGGRFVEPDGSVLDGPVVALVRPENRASGKTMCSGTLIAPDLVLTAAHCFMDVRPQNVEVVFGTNVSLTSQERVRGVRFGIGHEGFDAQAAREGTADVPPNDIALVQLLGEAPAGVRPLPWVRGQGTPAGELLLAGFGLQDVTNLASSGRLKVLPALLQYTQPSRKTLVVQGNDPVVMPSGAHPGDSGGPALLAIGDSYGVVGVDSTGSQSVGGFTGQNTYTDVRAYGEWIERVSAELRSGSLRTDVAPHLVVYAFGDRADGTVGFTVTNNSGEPFGCEFRAVAQFDGQEWENVELRIRGTASSGVVVRADVGARNLPESGAPYLVFDVVKSKPAAARSVEVTARCNGVPAVSRRVAVEWRS